MACEAQVPYKGESFYTLPGTVGTLVSLTGLTDLSLNLPQRAVVPAALGQLKGLRSLELCSMSPCVLEAGCLDLPNLLSLYFRYCSQVVLPGVPACPCLTCIEFTGDIPHTCVFDPVLAQLQLRRIVLLQSIQILDQYRLYRHALPGLHGLPADMGMLSSSLLHLDVRGLRITKFPIALTHLAALECLDASMNEFAELPAAITALSRLVELRLGRMIYRYDDPLQLRSKRRLDARALGDLSCFPALRELTFSFCEVTLCPSMPGAVRHASLTTLCFCCAHPAPECAPVVMQLRQALRPLRRGSVVRATNSPMFIEFPVGFTYHSHSWEDCVNSGLQKAQGQAPWQKFKAELDAL